MPTQLQRLLQADRAQYLQQFDAVFLGGAPPWPSLLKRAQSDAIPLCLSYGMTETAAMVTALPPGAFLAGDRSSGYPMAHAEVRIERSGQSLPHNQIGQVVITAASVSGGYEAIATDSFQGKTYYTDDLGYFDATGALHITGRVSNKIISGGENIFPTEVEAAIKATDKVVDVCVFGIPDAQWGEAVTAVYVPTATSVSAKDIKAVLDTTLSRYKHPKHWIAVNTLSRNAQGKLSRLQLKHQLQAQLASLSNAAEKLAADVAADR